MIVKSILNSTESKPIVIEKQNGFLRDSTSKKSFKSIFSYI